MLSAVVICKDEAEHLATCLDALAPLVDDIVVIDLESSDNSQAVARRWGARVFERPHSDFADVYWEEGAMLAIHDWILRMDPDETVPPGAVQQALACTGESVAIVEMPYVNFFAGRELARSPWGGTKWVAHLFHRNRVTFPKTVHTGLRPLEDFETLRPASDCPPIAHHWVSGWREWARKHVRYLRHEGERMRSQGHRFSCTAMARAVAGAAWFGLIERRGWSGRPTEVVLSIAFPLYVAMSWLKLRGLERRGDH